MGHPRACVALLAGEPIGLAERGEVLMAIEFPDDLVVADLGRIEIRDPAPVDQRACRSAHRVEVPIDRIAEREAAISQKIERAGRDTLRLCYNRSCLIRKLRSNSSERASLIVECREEAVWPRGDCAHLGRTHSVSRRPGRSRCVTASGGQLAAGRSESPSVPSGRVQPEYRAPGSLRGWCGAVFERYGTSRCDARVSGDVIPEGYFAVTSCSYTRSTASRFAAPIAGGRLGADSGRASTSATIV